MFEFLETSLDFPASAVKHENFLNGESQICRANGDPAGLIEYPDDAGRASERPERNDLIEGKNIAVLAVKEYRE